MTDSKPIKGITEAERAKQPWYDLEGALDDLQRVSTTDQICLQTIARACRNLFAYESSLVATERERDALRERVERLEAALRPFAKCGENSSEWQMGVVNMGVVNLTFGDFCRVREALADKEEG